MISFLRRLNSDRRGNALVIAGATLPLLVGAAGLATDTIQWALWKRQLQRAADSAAIAGVYDRVQNQGATTNVSTAVSRDLALNQRTGIALQSGYPQVSFPADSGTMTTQVRVVLAVQRKLSFSGMFMTNPPMIITSATAASVPGSDDYCVVSLENTTKTGIEGSGSADVQMNCGMITNSISNNAAAAKGSAYIKATVIAAAGGIQQSDNWDVGKYDPFVPALEDPYKDVTPNSSDMNCAVEQNGSGNGNGNGNNSGVALTESTNLNTVVGEDPSKPVNCYSSLSVGSNQTLVLPAGTYYINGGNVNIQGTLVATAGVTIVLTNKSTAPNATIGNFDMNASGSMNITAPTSGPFAGIAVYQDRRAQDTTGGGDNITSGSPNKINGNSSQHVIGALYFPGQQITYNGNGTGGYVCTQFVVKRIVFSGNNGSANQFEKNCNGRGMRTINGGRRVRLVA